MTSASPTVPLRQSTVLPRTGIAVLWLSALFDGVLLRLFAGTPVGLLWRDALLFLLVAWTVVAPEARRRALRVPHVALAVWFGAALVSLVLSSVETWLGVLGLRATFQWVLLVYVSAAWLDAEDARRGLLALVPLLAVTVAVSVWQVQIGVAGLQELGYEYYTNLREAGTQLRAFGTFVYDAPYAHSNALFAVALVALSLHERGRTRLVAMLGVVLAVAAMVLALNRTAVLAAVLGSAVVVWHLRSRARLDWRRALPVVAAGLLVLAVLLGVRGGSFFLQLLDHEMPSVADRLRIWPTLLSVDNVVVGDGPATVGAAAFTEEVRESGDVLAAQEYVTDGYYLATFAQYGLVGLAALLAFVVGVARRLVPRAPPAPLARDVPDREASAAPADWLTAAGAGVFAAVAAMMVVVNFWDDFPTPLFAWTIVGAALAVRGAGPQPSASDR